MIDIGLTQDFSQAACLDVPDPDIFFPEGSQRTIQQAKAICITCPIAVDCLRYAVDNELTYGVFGGLTATERKKFTKRLLRAQEKHGQLIAQGHKEREQLVGSKP